MLPGHQDTTPRQAFGKKLRVGWTNYQTYATHVSTTWKLHVT